LLRTIAKKDIGLFGRLLQASGLGHIGHQLREIFYRQIVQVQRNAFSAGVKMIFFRTVSQKFLSYC
jgi:hypothetical protein